MHNFISNTGNYLTDTYIKPNLPLQEKVNLPAYNKDTLLHIFLEDGSYKLRDITIEEYIEHGNYI